MIGIDEAVQRAIDAKTQLYNRKASCPDHLRDAELRNLYRLAEAAPDGAAAEIGVKRGGSLLCWLCAREGRGPVYAIDDWSSKTEQALRANVEHYNAQIEIVTGKSWEVAASLSVQFAFVFIDGDHGAGIWRDVPTWTSKVMPGGVIAFHDYGVRKITVQVKEAVDQWRSAVRWIALPQVGSTLAFKRPFS
jgi:predicted O-methyltransferase YrrM